MSKIKNGGLHQYGAEPFEQLQFGTAGAEGVKLSVTLSNLRLANLQNFYTAGKRIKFATKNLRSFPVYLDYVATLPWEAKVKIC